MRITLIEPWDELYRESDWNLPWKTEIEASREGEQCHPEDYIVLGVNGMKYAHIKNDAISIELEFLDVSKEDVNQALSEYKSHQLQ